MVQVHLLTGCMIRDKSHDQAIKIHILYLTIYIRHVVLVFVMEIVRETLQAKTRYGHFA